MKCIQYWLLWCHHVILPWHCKSTLIILQDDYDDNQVNPHNKKDEEKDADNLDLPDDLNLDDGEKKDKGMFNLTEGNVYISRWVGGHVHIMFNKKK